MPGFIRAVVFTFQGQEEQGQEQGQEKEEEQEQLEEEEDQEQEYGQEKKEQNQQQGQQQEGIMKKAEWLESGNRKLKGNRVLLSLGQRQF